MHVVQVDSKNLDGEPMPHEKYGLLGQAESTEDFMKSQVATRAGLRGGVGQDQVITVVVSHVHLTAGETCRCGVSEVT